GGSSAGTRWPSRCARGAWSCRGRGAGRRGVARWHGARSRWSAGRREGADGGRCADRGRMPFGCVVQPFGDHAMVNLTLKGMTDETYERLKARATAEHRSINRQAIALIELELSRQAVDVKAWLEETARMRKRLGIKGITLADIDAAKKRGRR